MSFGLDLKGSLESCYVSCDSGTSSKLSDEQQPLTEAQRPVIMATRLASLDSADSVSTRLTDKGSARGTGLDGEVECCVEKDRGLAGLLVVLVSFLCNGFMFSMINCYGIIYIELLRQLREAGDNNAAFKCALVGSLATGLLFLISALSGVMADKIGIRRTAQLGASLMSISLILSSFFINTISALYVLYGVLFGTGCSLVYTPSLAVLGQYFDRRLGMVNGIVSLGSSVFTVPMPFLLSYLIKTVGLGGTFRLLSICFAVLVPCMYAFKPRQQQQQQQKIEQKSASSVSIKQKCDFGAQLKQKSACKAVFRRIHVKLSELMNFDIWKNRRYVLWAVAVPLGLFGYFVPYVHLVQYSRLRFPDQDGTWLVPCIGLASGVGRIIFGLLADLPCINKIFLQQLSIAMIGAMTILMVFCQHYYLLYVVSIIMGLFDGCFVSLLGTIAFQLVGPKGASQAIGCLLSLMSLPMTVGPPIAGFMFDKSSSYTMAFCLAGVPSMVSALVMCFIHRLKPTNHQRHLLKQQEAKAIEKEGATNADV